MGDEGGEEKNGRLRGGAGHTGLAGPWEGFGSLIQKQQESFEGILE